MAVSAATMASLLSTPTPTHKTPLLPNPFLPLKPLSLRPSPHKALLLFKPLALSSPQPASPSLVGPTRTLSTLAAAAAFLVSRGIVSPLPAADPLIGAGAGALFFAAVRRRDSTLLSTPMTVVAAGVGKWLEIYSTVLLVRVLLSWFPNIPWERQPLNAMRDLCDPYLNLFRNIIPPVFDTLDVSPLLAFAVMGAIRACLGQV